MDLHAVNASKLKMFREAIDKQADYEIRSVTKKIRAKKNAAGKVRAELAVREALAGIRAEQSAAEARFKKELSRCDFEIERAVRIHRKELVEAFFEELRGDLQKFAEESGYAEYLKKSAQRAKDELGEDCVILARAADVKKLESLTKLTVREYNDIRLGGICAVDEKRGLYADFSLDKALEDEKNAFSEHSELRL